MPVTHYSRHQKWNRPANVKTLQNTLFSPSFVSSFLSQIWSISPSSRLFDYLFAHQCQSSAGASVPSSSLILHSVSESCQRLFRQQTHTPHHTQLHKQASKHSACTHSHINIVMETYRRHIVDGQSLPSMYGMNAIWCNRSENTAVRKSTLVCKLISN